MSNKELDSLFKNKLEDHSVKPNSELWTAINSQLPEKKYTPNYWLMGIAASLLVLAGIGIGFYINSNDIDQVPQLANEFDTKKSLLKETETVKSEEQKESIAQNSTNDYKKEISKKIESSPIVKSKQFSSIKSSMKNKEEPEKTSTLQNLNLIDSLDNVLDSELNNTSLEKNIAKVEVPDATIKVEMASTKQDAGNTLVFDISEFTKESAVASTKNKEDKKESKLKQLYNIAKDIKQGESGLSELREAKNDLFAMNTRKNDKGE